MARPPTRGQLLRAILRSAKELRELDESTNLARDGIAAATSSKEELQTHIAETEAELDALRAQHKFESENDRDLVQLQRVNNIMALRKQELVRATTLARKERDRGKTEQAAAYYTRVGAALEHQRLLCSGAPLLLSSLAPPSSSGPPELRQLRADADVLWRKASAASVAIKDMVHAALAFSGRSATVSTWPLHPLCEEVDAAAKLAWVPSAAAAGGSLVGSTASDAPAIASADPSSKCHATLLPPLLPPAVATAPGYLAYASLGPASLLADTVRAIEATESMSAELAALEGRAPAGVGPLAQLSLVRQHLLLQLELLTFARDVARAQPGSAAAMPPVGGDSKGQGEPEPRAAPLPETPEPAAHREAALEES